jgi:putative addiction module component (TIGR02574 family)
MTDVTLTEPAGFNGLSKADQIRYVQMLWNKIAVHPDDVPILDSHWLELQDRAAEYRANPSQTQNAYEALDRLQGKSKR